MKIIPWWSSLLCQGFLLVCQPVSAAITPDSIPASDSTLVREIRSLRLELKALTEQAVGGGTKKQDTRKRVRVGLSLGYRWLTAASRYDYMLASVSPIDSTLRLTPLGGTSYLFSTAVIFDPFDGSSRDVLENRPSVSRGHSRPGLRKRRAMGRSPRLFWNRQLDRLCLVSNLNLLDFSSGQKELAFNKNIEGGLGIGYRLSDFMLIGINWEHVQSYQLHEDIKALEGRKVSLYGLPLVNSNQLDLRNEDLFYVKNLSGWSLKMIITL